MNSLENLSTHAFIANFDNLNQEEREYGLVYLERKYYINRDEIYRLIELLKGDIVKVEMEYYFNNNVGETTTGLRLTYYIESTDVDGLLNNKMIELKIIGFDDINIYTKHYTDDLMFEEIYEYNIIKDDNILSFLLEINYSDFHDFIELNTDINKEILNYKYKELNDLLIDIELFFNYKGIELSSYVEIYYYNFYKNILINQS